MRWNKKICVEYITQLKSPLEEVQQDNNGQKEGWSGKIKQAIDKMRGGQPETS